MTQLAQRLCLDLPDTFSSDSKRLADLFARRERAQDLSRLVLEVDIDHRIRRGDNAAILDEVAQMRIFLFANRRFEGDRLLRDLQHFADFRHGNIHPLGDLFRRRFASQFLHQLPRRADQLVDRLDHVHRDTNRTRLIGNGTRNRLPDPPRGIGRELIPTAVFELVDGLHQADVAFLNQVEELQPAIGVFLCNRNDETQVGFNQLALRLLGVHVALDDLALCALELLEQQSRFDFKLFEFAVDGARLLLVFLALLFAARAFGPLLQVLDLPVERAHAVDRAVHTLNQAFAFVVGEAQFAHRLRRAHDGAGQVAPVTAIVAWTLLLVYRRQLFDERHDLLVKLVEHADLAQKFLQPLVDDLFGDFLFVEGDQFLDGADTFFEILAQSEKFANHNRRARERLQYAVLAALNALGDFDFALAREQRHGSHLAQIHADGIIGFFQSARSEVEFNVLGAFFHFLEFFFQIGRRPFRTFEYIDSLRSDRGQQIFQVFRRVHIVRDKVERA